MEKAASGSEEVAANTLGLQSMIGGVPRL